MNAPVPTPDPGKREPASPARCATTQLAVPECSCQICLTQLMQAYAPALLAADSTQPALS